MRRFRLQSILTALVLWLAAALPSASHAEAPPLKAYFFGNSLVHHLDGLPLTSTPYWLNLIAQTRGTRLQADGSWGFLLNHAAQLPPEPNWQISGVRGVWERRKGSLGQSDISAVVLTPANFLQFQSPTAIIPGDNPDRLSAVAASLKVLDWANSDPGDTEMRFFLYQGWADMAGVVDQFPPSRTEFNAYLAAQSGAYDQWYRDYAAALKQARPNMSLEVLPIATTLAKILKRPELAALRPTDLFTDDAPHGTATIYFLAALISYGPMFGDELPTQMSLPEVIHPLVRQHYPTIVQTIQTARTGALRPPQTIQRDLARDTAPPAVPALGIGLNGISDWSTQMPFIDQMKSARPWIGHKTGQWGGMDAATMRANGDLNAEGWPRRMPNGVERLETFVLTDLPADADMAAGRYRLTYNGNGRIQLLGRAQDVTARPGEMWFSFTPGDGLVAISIAAIDETDPIRNIRVIHERHLPFWTMGEQFNPDWLAQIEDMRVLRFMDWMATNDSPITTWDERPRIDDYSYSWRGVPVEVMVDLANRVGADPWFNMPHRADDTYVRRFAEMVAADLAPELKAYVEYSNEVWNFLFSQAQYASDQAIARWGQKVRDSDAWMQWAGLRAAEVATIWTDVFGDQTQTRLVRVIATHTGWQGLEQALLNAPLYTAEDRTHRAPAAHFDAYAITGYFGHSLGRAPQAAQVKDWLRLGQSEALKRSYKLLKNGEVQQLIRDTFPYHARVAAAHDMALLMYEGGTHITTEEGWQNDDQLNDFFITLNYSQEMAALYSEVIEGWQAAGGTLFNAFVDVAAPSKWGSWGGMRHLADNNPRWAVLQQANATLSTEWETRDPIAFRRGRTLAGTEQDEVIEGTPLPEVLVAGPGDDWLISNGGADRLHGGAGTDTAILPGAAQDYQISWAPIKGQPDAGAFLIANGPLGEVRMFAVEQLEFSDAPNQIYRITPRE